MFQVNNVSSVVWQLESFDKNGVLVTHREMAALRKQLAECEDAVTNLNFGVPAVGRLTHEYGEYLQWAGILLVVGWKWSVKKPSVLLILYTAP